jgi:hypothetical protein
LRENVTAVIVISITRTSGDRSGADASKKVVTTAWVVGTRERRLDDFFAIPDGFNRASILK